MAYYNDKVHRMREILQEEGITVLDARITDRRKEYTAYGTSGSERITYHRTEQSVEDVVWDLRMNFEKVQEMLDLQRQVDYYCRNSKKSEMDLHQTEQIVSRYQSQTGQLRMVLNEHPEIKEQWDEFMILLKMAGLDADVLKLIT
jgi:hypothetical protein